MGLLEWITDEENIIQVLSLLPVPSVRSHSCSNLSNNRQNAGQRVQSSKVRDSSPARSRQLDSGDTSVVVYYTGIPPQVVEKLGDRAGKKALCFVSASLAISTYTALS
jgi:hypothetical protein